MSTFGSPGGRQVYQKPTPPEKGSFPLDHYAECKSQMTTYLRCLRRARGDNGAPECRQASRDYLACRMEHGLMAKEEWRNLGFKDRDEGTAGAGAVEEEGGAQDGK